MLLLSRAEIIAVKCPYVAIALLLIQCWPAGAADQNCMSDYYRTKSPGCIDSMLSQLRQPVPGSKADPSTIIGFLAQLFSASPEEKQRILSDEPSDYVRSVYLVALYRAGLLDDARTFADSNQLSGLLQKLKSGRIAALATLRPSSTAADNDLLIGAYMASGDTAFIERILENFSGADDVMVSDGLRMGYLMGKFGNSLAPKERESVTMAAARAKYQFDIDPAKFLRVLTLMTASWALSSLANHDDGIRRTVAGFFEHNARLKNLLLIEQTAFGNYLTYLAVVLTLSSHASVNAMSKSVLAYEKLEPASDAFPPIEAPTKSGKPSK
jgi:hypothetical protein